MTGVFLMDEAGEVLVPELKFAVISVAGSSTDSALVSGVAGKRIRVVSYELVATAATTVLFESGTTTALSGTMSLAINDAIDFAGSSDAPAFETVAGEDLVVTTGAGAIEGHLAYVEVAG